MSDDVVTVQRDRLMNALETSFAPYRDFLLALEQAGRISPEEHRAIQDAVAQRLQAIGTFLLSAAERTPPRPDSGEVPPH